MSLCDLAIKYPITIHLILHFSMIYIIFSALEKIYSFFSLIMGKKS